MSTTDFGKFEKVLRIGEGRRVKRLKQQAAFIATLEPGMQALSDDELRAKTVEFRQRLENGETLEELLFGLVFGLYWTGVYEHFAWRVSVPHAPADAEAPQPAG